jgi:hypothetical protein
VSDDPRIDALVARLEGVATQSQAMQAADDAVAYGTGALSRWTGLNALTSTPRDTVQAAIGAVTLARQSFHSVGSPDFPVSLALPEVSPDWPPLAQAIQGLYITVWAQEKYFPETSAGGDLFHAGAGAAGDGLTGLGNSLKDALGPLLWPVGIAVGLALAALVFIKVGAKA